MSGDVWLESAKLRRKGVKEVEHMNIELRLETPADYAETEKVVREAFWNVYAPGCTEHYLVHVMRSSENFVRELAFVAVADSTTSPSCCASQALKRLISSRVMPLARQYLPATGESKPTSWQYPSATIAARRFIPRGKGAD